MLVYITKERDNKKTIVHVHHTNRSFARYVTAAMLVEF